MIPQRIDLIDISDPYQSALFEVAEQLTPPHTQKVSPPDFMHGKELLLPNIADGFLSEEYAVPALDVLKFQKCSLVGRQVIISEELALFPDARPFPEFLPKGLVGAPYYRDEKTPASYIRHDVDLPTNPIGKPCLLFSSRGEHMHHHWVFDVLSKLYIWEEVFNKSVAIAVPSTLKNYQRQTYFDLGVKESDIVDVDQNVVTEFDTLYSAPCFSTAQRLYAPPYSYIRNRIFETYAIDPTEVSPTTNKVFMGRSDVPDHARALINETRLAELSEAKGFVTMSGGDLPFPEQIKLFAGMETCIMLHGSAGANLLFGNENLKVVHLHPDCVGSFKAHAYINSYVGHSYGYIFGLSFFRPQRIHANPWYIDEETMSNVLSECSPSAPIGSNRVIT